jgi:ATPase subunit of ABC transporter with duplicated ATPase domains
MYSKIMLSHGNTLIIDSPTTHLDLESIIAVNKGLDEFKGAVIVASHDHKLLQTVCNKIIEIGDLGAFSYDDSLDEYIANQEIKSKVQSLYRIDSKM